jgi:cytochrome b561
MEKKQSDGEALNEEMRNIIEEARVILPGIQALFGFQTIAVFNQRFVELPEYAKDCHLIGLGMVIIAVALVMTPAVYYRYVGRDHVTPQMISLSSLMIRAALFPLACGLGLDIFTVILTATDRPQWSAIGAGFAFVFLIALWFVFPISARHISRSKRLRPAPKRRF